MRKKEIVQKFYMRNVEYAHYVSTDSISNEQLNCHFPKICYFFYKWW